MKKPRGAGSKGDECSWQEEYGSVCRDPSPIYPPLQAAAHWARRFMPAPHAGHTWVLTRGAQVPPISHRWQRSDGTVAQKWIAPHILYVWHSVSPGIAYTIASTPATSAARRPIGSGIMVMIASSPTTSVAQ
jgi:hypothetical protein